MTSLPPAICSTSPTSNRYEIRAGARLHLGLVEIHPGASNCFGGIGWMVSDPASVVQFQVGSCSVDQLQIDAPDGWRSRVVDLCQRWLAANPQALFLPIEYLRLESHQRPHQGLGSGTQWSAMVVHALTAAGMADPTHCPLSLDGLARLSHRGLRSFVGLAGYLTGGMIIDLGQPFHPRVQSLPFPPWPTLLIRDETSEGESGDAERTMFQICSQVPNPARKEMLSLIWNELVPAVETKDWHRWDSHIGVYGQLAGRVFEKVQGGVYRSKSIQRIIDIAKSLGFQGAAQSSWGPTVALVLPDVSIAERLMHEFQSQLRNVSCTWTQARNHGSSVTRIP